MGGGGQRRTAQDPANDPTDPRREGGDVYSTLGHRCSNISDDTPVCQGSRIQRSASIQISGVGTGNKKKSKVQYRVLLRKIDGRLAEFTPYGVEKITGDAVRMNLEKAKALFPSAACKLESPNGPIHMLIGMDHMKDALREQERVEGVVLYQLEFSTGYVACRDMNQESPDQRQESSAFKVLSCRSGLFNSPEFIPAEAMGTELPRRCPACKN